MLEGLPIEIVGHILRVLAEMSVVSDRATLLRITYVGSIGYTAAVPVLYRTVTVKKSNFDAIARFFDELEQPVAVSRSGGILRLPPTIRLCPYIRRITLEVSSPFHYLRLLPNIETIVTITGNRGIFPSEDLPHLSKSLTHYASLTTAYPYTIPPTVTHASFYISVWAESVLVDFRNYAALVLHDGITHIAIELNDQIDEMHVPQLRKLLKDLICRTTTVLVVLRLYRGAVLHESEAAVIRAIRGIVSTVDLQQRFLIWEDKREMDTVSSDVDTSLRDVMEGRTPWAEGRPVDQARLADAREVLDGETQED